MNAAECQASYPTGGTNSRGAIHHPCSNPATDSRFARLPMGWAIHFRLCDPHAMLWDAEVKDAGGAGCVIAFGRV